MSSPIKPTISSAGNIPVGEEQTRISGEPAPSPAPASEDKATLTRGKAFGRAAQAPAARGMRSQLVSPPSWPKIARHYFSGASFQALHPDPGSPIYHSAQHSENVASLMSRLASKFAPEHAKFLSEVALIHDVDPSRKPGTPARVPATLEWIDQNKAELGKRFGWGDRQTAMAKAIIMRTEFPFDENTRPVSYNDFYKEKSPAAHYRGMIQNLAPEDRALVLRTAPILSEYADKGSWYMKPFPAAHHVVQGLANEITALGGKADVKSLNTAGFLESIGKPESFALDYKIAASFLPGIHIPLKDEIFQGLSAGQRKNFETNIRKFKALQDG